jgi:hypothetical protein
MNPLAEISNAIRQILEIIDFRGDQAELIGKIETNIYSQAFLEALKTVPVESQTKFLAQLKTNEISREDFNKQVSAIVNETVLQVALATAAKEQLKAFLDNIIPQVPSDQQQKIKAVLLSASEKLTG